MNTRGRPVGAPPDPSPGGAGARGLFLLAVAVALGIGLLQAFDDGGDAFDTVVGTGSNGGTVTVPDVDLTTVPPTTAGPARNPIDVRVLPVNGTRTSGLGKKTGDVVKGGGYNVLGAVDTQGGRLLETSAVQFAPDYESEARAIAELLELEATAVQPLSSPPVADTRDANIVVLIGPELTRLGATSASTTTTTIRR